MNAKAIAVLLTMIAADIAYGQIQGKVVDVAGKPIPEVAVSIEGTSYEAETDAKGQYSISYFPGQFTVNYEKADYFPENLALSLAVKDVFPAKKIVMSPMPPADSLSVIGPPDRPYIQLLPSTLITPSSSETEPGEGSLNSFNPDFGKSARYTFAGDYLVLPNTAEIGFIQRSAAIRKAKGARPETDYSIYKFRSSDRGAMYLTVTSSPFPEELGTKPGCDDCVFREPVPALSDGFYAFIMSRTERDMWSDAFLSHKALNERIYAFKISADTSEWYKVKSIRPTSSRTTQPAGQTDGNIDNWPNGTYVFTIEERTAKEIDRYTDTITIDGNSFTYDIEYKSELLPNAQAWTDPGLKNAKECGNTLRITGEIVDIRPGGFSVKRKRKEIIIAYPPEWQKPKVLQERFFGTWSFVRTPRGIADKYNVNKVFKQTR